MTERTIENLQEVLSGLLEKDKKIRKINITNLTAPGENYGSIMSKLDITVKNEKNGSEEEVHAVAKQIPEKEMARKIFNIQVTFKNEIAMYDTIVPTLQAFQRENGVNEVIDCFPKFYGGRINLQEGSGTVDEDAVLILENLITKGYQVVDRHIGFDLKTTKLILKDLAAFHSIPIALKLRKPHVFDEKIRPYLAPFRLPSIPHQENHKSMLIEVLEESQQCLPWVSKVRDIFKNEDEIHDKPPREPFSTIAHGDMWVNNTMVKFEDGIPISNKLVDFQVCDYKSGATDVFFFLFTSVQLPVLQEHLDDLISFYHKQFIFHLQQLMCDLAPFTFSRFLEEMRAATAAEIQHTIMMLTFIVFGKKGGASKDLDEEEEPDFEKMRKDMNQTAKEKAWFLVQACAKRGWL